MSPRKREIPRVTVPAARLLETSHPLLLEVNARLLVREQGVGVTLGSLPDAVLEEWAALGFDAVWLMGVWRSGEMGRTIALEHEGLRQEYHRALPDFTPADVGGSPYAIQAYEPEPELGDFEDLGRLRDRLHERGLGLVLDFVPNHTARDHDWVEDHPEYYVHGNAGEERDHPELFFRAATVHGDETLAFGRDPNFPGWTDTAQLNYQSTALRRAMIDLLRRIASVCDGVRCDMAMLALRDIFLGTWGSRVCSPGSEIRGEFWREAIDTVHADAPDFHFLAEAYWGKEWDLQQLGFAYTYDKTLYDRLRHEGARPVREHLNAEMAYQQHSLRFIENHDEATAMTAFPGERWQCAAATIMLTVPGMAMLHDGQLTGRTRRLPVQLLRRASEPVNERLRGFYRSLLAHVQHPIFRSGSWRQLQPRSAWHGNSSWDNFLAFWWEGPAGGRRLVVVNYAPLSSQCYLDIPLDEGGSGVMEFRDLLGSALYTRERTALQTKGMYFDLPPYEVHLFGVTLASR